MGDWRPEDPATVPPTDVLRLAPVVVPALGPPTARWCWRIFEPEPRRIAPGHESCSRRRAGPARRMAIAKKGSLFCDGIDVERWDRTTRYAAAVDGKIVPAKIIGDDENNVRGTFVRRNTHRSISAGLPGNFPVGLHRSALHAVADKSEQDFGPENPGSAQ